MTPDELKQERLSRGMTYAEFGEWVAQRLTEADPDGKPVKPYSRQRIYDWENKIVPVPSRVEAMLLREEIARLERLLKRAEAMVLVDADEICPLFAAAGYQVAHLPAPDLQDRGRKVADGAVNPPQKGRLRDAVRAVFPARPRHCGGCSASCASTVSTRSAGSTPISPSARPRPPWASRASTCAWTPP